MNQDIAIGITTLSSVDSARDIVKILLDENLIACGHIESGIESHYEWNSNRVIDKEVRVTIKFKLTNAVDIEQIISKHHEYEIPQWVFWSVESSDSYNEWVTKPKGK